MTKLSRIRSMDKQTQEKLEARGWQVGSVADLLELTPEESILVEIRLILSRHLEEWHHRSQAPHPSNSLQDVEAQDSEYCASIEQLLLKMLSAGVSPQEIGRLIASVN